MIVATPASARRAPPVIGSLVQGGEPFETPLTVKKPPVGKLTQKKGDILEVAPQASTAV